MKISFHEFFLGIVFEINIDLTFFFIILKVVASPEDGYVRTESEINKDEKLDFEWVSYDGFMPHYRKTYIQKMKDLWQSDLHPNARIGKMHALKKYYQLISRPIITPVIQFHEFFHNSAVTF